MPRPIPSRRKTLLVLPPFRDEARHAESHSSMFRVLDRDRPRCISGDCAGIDEVRGLELASEL
jgi:hypothetical protein